MARVLLANFDDQTGRELARLFVERQHRVTKLPAIDAGLSSLEIAETEYDLIILDVSLESRVTHDILTRLTKSATGKERRAGLLCVTRTYHGSRFDLDLERSGARLVYVR